MHYIITHFKRASFTRFVHSFQIAKASRRKRASRERECVCITFVYVRAARAGFEKKKVKLVFANTKIEGPRNKKNDALFDKR